MADSVLSQQAQEDLIQISVVVPCYNSRSTIGDCLRSLEAQRFPREQYEVLVADNGSHDGSVAFITEHFPAVRVVHAQQKGSGYARNAGIAQARGEWVFSTDADCVADPDWMFMLMRAFLEAPKDTGAIGGTIVPFSTNTRIERFRSAWVTQPAAEDPSSKIRYTATPNAAFRTEVLRELGGFDGTLGFDDTDLGIRIAAAGYRIAFEAGAVVRHRNPVTLKELYRHRVKYGEFGYTIARKHKDLYGDPAGRAKRLRLLGETAWRVLKDFLKLPMSLLPLSSGKPIGWPAIDAAMALGNYRGFRKASLNCESRRGRERGQA